MTKRVKQPPVVSMTEYADRLQGREDAAIYALLGWWAGITSDVNRMLHHVADASDFARVVGVEKAREVRGSLLSVLETLDGLVPDVPEMSRYEFAEQCARLAKK